MKKIKATAAGMAGGAGLLLAASTALAFSFDVWERWDSDTAVTGGEGIFGISHFTRDGDGRYVLGVAGNPGEWATVGRLFSPPDGAHCTAFAFVRYARGSAPLPPGTIISKVIPLFVDGALEIIDADTWAYERKVDFRADRAGDFEWQSGSWTADGGSVMVRATVHDDALAASLELSDIVVECD